MAEFSYQYKVEVLSKSHNKKSFTCGVTDLDQYLQRQASQDLRRKIAVTFVLVELATNDIVGFYTLSSFAILLNDLPEEVSKKLPRYDLIPATLIGRLAVSDQRKGEGIGRLLLANALRKCYTQSLEIASFAVIVDAKDQQAVNFYEHFGFIKFAEDKDRLFLPMQTIKKELSDS